jgi:hypothetical protein
VLQPCDVASRVFSRSHGVSWSLNIRRTFLLAFQSLNNRRSMLLLYMVISFLFVDASLILLSVNRDISCSPTQHTKALPIYVESHLSSQGSKRHPPKPSIHSLPKSTRLALFHAFCQLSLSRSNPIPFALPLVTAWIALPTAFRSPRSVTWPLSLLIRPPFTR